MRERRLRGDGGAATTELVIVAPILVSMIMLIIQFGLYFHASTVASAAAQEGAGTAAVLQADMGTRIGHGEDQATEFVQTMAPELLTDLNVHGEPADAGDSVRMTVEAEVIDVLAVPGVDMDLQVEETSENVLEDFQPADEDPVGES